MFGNIPTEGQFIEATLIKGRPYPLQSSKDELTPQEAMRIIHSAPEMAILAHPSFYLLMGESFDELCKKFLEMGIDGFKSINIQYDRGNGDLEINHLKPFTTFALRHSLVISDGSDYHIDDEVRLGKFIDLGFRNHVQKVPYTILEQLKSAKRKIQRSA